MVDMETAVHIVQGLIILFVFGLLVDYPEQKRKRRAKCAEGIHQFGAWRDLYEIHNGNDVWERKCRHCRAKESTVSKLVPKSIK